MSHHSSDSKDKSSKESLGMFQVLRHPDTKRATLAVMTVMVAQQFSGKGYQAAYHAARH